MSMYIDPITGKDIEFIPAETDDQIDKLERLLSTPCYIDKKGNVFINRQQVCVLLNVSECQFHRLKRADPNFPVKAFYNGRDHYLLDDVLSYKANR